ncbi:MAG: response regulator transcription factor [Bacteroidales bacterium]|nr:response regulator transcription factor [Bacteroidales bacterium]MCF8457583.1 response regulator transcription factor [Bacteroidales bacterium]
METIRLIIADDHPIITDGLRSIFKGNKEIDLVAEVHDGTELLELLKSTPGDVILMDINMPVMNGIEACQIIQKEFPDIKVIAFSQYDDKRFVKRILKTGASGYLLKNTPAPEIVEAIKTVHQGETYLSKELSTILFTGQNTKSKSSLFPNLSKREIEITRMICQEKSTQEIADELFLSPHTVETHRANILLKLGVKNTAGLVRWAVENEIV